MACKQYHCTDRNPCLACQEKRSRKNGGNRNRRNSGWEPRASQPPQVGFVLNDGPGNDHLVSFKQGYGANEGHTLIADGVRSREDFNYKDGRYGHDHYGPGDGANDNGTTGRHRYTGPGA